MTAPNLPGLLRPSEVETLLGISRVTLWQWRRKGQFPQPIQINPNCFRYREADVRDWFEKKGLA